MPPTAKTAGHLSAEVAEQAILMHTLLLIAVFGCIALAAVDLIAEFFVPNQDWIAGTITDLGAGRYEIIVDTGRYALSAALIARAVFAAPIHLGAWDCSLGIIALVISGLVVFPIRPRNEYGGNGSEGRLIHTDLVYALDSR
ncbi:hypothetical protein J7376_13340 [Paracoccus sp. R12_1]|uniref:hypothetical protein n=1 Tax=unclassified Paracoccus (in: a-proteobacteria) TaxID=2688777 RepID=UPI001ADCB1CE|nr:MULTISPECIES: hypothetical protein [unclassified Paracoccus (in: a-proteobacteria)]MBO9456197.1 hypothetical protein [Paracoccus sp. R12_2]MBO9487510.1 hypothetical protein [Paracoccus sp. R12_1]